ncbi:hypothetical protein MAR621_04069 [Maribacter dokdonensis]|uniref:hypothetical protein n=1 Tax=Maribacter dokdonensis TaxID=320912 RepID=UPI001B253AD7|nr:hypothetical protein [Maribacter dokdonensis]CAG2534396.1 hypothetical protein MAR621_04069 [Maribacter dokdonensis]
MDRILEKYGLQKQININAKNGLDEIVQKMDSESNGEYYSFIFAIMDIFQPRHQKLVGKVNNQGFLVRKRVGFFDFFPNWAKVTGKFQKTEKGTEISMKINGMSKLSAIVEIGILTFLCLIAGLIIFEALIPPIGEVNPFPDLFILIVIGFFFVLVPVMHAKWNINRINRDLKRYFE